MNGASRLVKLLAVVGALAIAAGVMGAAAGVFMIRRGFSARDEPSAAEAMAARTMRRLSVPSKYGEMKNPVTLTPELLAGAKAHWADHCATCHSNDGSGTTAIGRGLFPRAPDMRAEATQSLSDGELYYVIENGIRLTGMPAWGTGGDDSEDSWALVGFIRTLPKLTPAEIEEMKKLNPLSAAQCAAQREEDEFLNGGAVDPNTTPQPEHKHD